MSPISEDELRARLRGVEPAPAQPGFAEHLVHQGRFRRRRQRWLAGIAAAAAVAVIGGGAFMINDQWGRETALPATPTPSPTQPEVTPTVTSTRSPTATTTPSPTNTEGTSIRPSSTPSPSSSPSRSVTLKPVTLLHDGEGGWVKSTFQGGPCAGEAAVIPTPKGYEELRVIWDSYIAGANRNEGLVVFPSADAAVSYMENVRRVVTACNDESSGDVKTLVQPLAGPWGDGLAVAQAGRDPHIEETRYVGTRVAVFVRVGRAVAFADFSNHSELEDTIDPEMIERSRPAIQHVVPQLCRYTKAGC